MSSEHAAPSAMRTVLPTVLAVVMLGAAWYFVRSLEFQLPPQFQDGEEALQARNTAEAQRLFGEAIRDAPHNPQLYVSIGAAFDTASWMRDPDRGSLTADYALRGLKACPGATADSLTKLYDLLADAYATEYPEHPQARAILAAEEALRHSPDDPGALNAMGYLLADNNQQLDRAQQLIARALRGLSGKYAGALSGPMVEDSYGWVLYRKADYNAAVDVLQQAANDLTPDTSAAAQKIIFYHLGAAYRMAGRLKEARAMLKRSLSFDAAYEPAQHELASLPPPPNPSPTTSSAPSRASGAEDSGYKVGGAPVPIKGGAPNN